MERNEASKSPETIMEVNYRTRIQNKDNNK